MLIVTPLLGVLASVSPAGATPPRPTDESYFGADKRRSVDDAYVYARDRKRIRVSGDTSQKAITEIAHNNKRITTRRRNSS
jgi:hypothetical protein